MKNTLKKYLLQKLQAMEEVRCEAHKMPADVIPGEDLRNSVLKDLDEAMDELVTDGLVHKGNTINGLYYKLEPENALEG